MALSGYFDTNSYEGRFYRFEWSATQNQANNTSTIAWTLSALGYGGWVAERTVNLVAGGATRFYKTDRVQRYPGTVATGSFTITHDSAGNASFSATLQVAIYDSSITGAGSGSWALNRINRGIVYICTSYGWTQYQPYIYLASGWTLYQPYIYTSSGWNLY